MIASASFRYRALFTLEVAVGLEAVDRKNLVAVQDTCSILHEEITLKRV